MSPRQLQRLADLRPRGWLCPQPAGARQYDQTLGYKFSYPYFLPKGIGGVPSVALDSKGNLWVFKRSPVGVTQLMKFDANHKLVLEVPESVISYQEKAHGMAVDAQDNVWIADAGQATVKKLSPDGKLLLTIGERGKRGDWIEEKGQRLLWQPVMIAFGPKGEVYIGMGHANESPNDVDSPRCLQQIRRGARHAADVGRQVRAPVVWQRGGAGQVQRRSWPGGGSHQRRCLDRRPRTVSHRGLHRRWPLQENLADPEPGLRPQFRPRSGNPWMASGQDGQFLKLNRDGKVVGAVGNGMGIGTGQFIEASYWVFDKNDNLIAGDTSVGRVTVMSK